MLADRLRRGRRHPCPRRRRRRRPRAPFPASTSRSAQDGTESLRQPPGDCATLPDRDRKPGPGGAGAARGRAAGTRRMRRRAAPARDAGRLHAVPTLRPEVLAELPHDPSAFTQGFEIDGGILYEGTGLEGRSQLRELDPETGAVRRSVPLPGAAVRRGHHGGGRPDLAADLARRRRARVGPGDADAAPRGPARRARAGGCAHDGARLVRSDGTDRLRFHDPATFAEQGSVAVTLDGAPVTELNELECVDGQVWANVWQTDRIVRIDPADRAGHGGGRRGRAARPGPAGRHGRAQRHRGRAGRRRRVPGHRASCGR